MSRTIKTEPKSEAPAENTTLEVGAKRGNVMLSAFESIFDSYGDEEEISLDLAMTRSKFEKLGKNIAQTKVCMNRVEAQLKKVLQEFEKLQDMIIEPPQSPSAEDTGFWEEAATVQLDRRADAAPEPQALYTLSDIKTMLEYSVKNLGRYADYQETMKRDQIDHEGVQSRVKMLEGVKAVADAGGMKRAREKALHAGVGKDELRVKRRRQYNSDDSDDNDD